MVQLETVFDIVSCGGFDDVFLLEVSLKYPWSILENQSEPRVHNTWKDTINLDIIQPHKSLFTYTRLSFILGLDHVI